MQRYRFNTIEAKKIFIIYIILLINIQYVHSQYYDYTGAIVIGNKEVQSYKIVYEMEGDKVMGYSLSDLNGKGETKCLIKGQMNRKSKTLIFEELQVVSTKSNVPLDEFCLMKVQGQFEKKLGKEIFQGSFSSVPQKPDLECERGSIIMTSTKTLYEVAGKISNKIDSVSSKDSMGQLINSKLSDLKGLKGIEEITHASVTKYKWRSDSVKIEIWDDKLEDGDKVAIYKNGELFIKEMTITNLPKSIHLGFGSSQKIEIKVKALSEGTHPPNTVKITLQDKSDKQLLITQLKKNEEATIILSKK